MGVGAADGAVVGAGVDDATGVSAAPIGGDTELDAGAAGGVGVGILSSGACI